MNLNQAWGSTCGTFLGFKRPMNKAVQSWIVGRVGWTLVRSCSQSLSLEGSRQKQVLRRWGSS